MPIIWGHMGPGRQPKKGVGYEPLGTAGCLHWLGPESSASRGPDDSRLPPPQNKHICLDVHTHIHMYMYVYIYTYIYIYTHKYLFLISPVYIYIYIYTYWKHGNLGRVVKPKALRQPLRRGHLPKCLRRAGKLSVDLVRLRFRALRV